MSKFETQVWQNMYELKENCDELKEALGGRRWFSLRRLVLWLTGSSRDELARRIDSIAYKANKQKLNSEQVDLESYYRRKILAYNGWSNYETWCASLWLSSTEAWMDEECRAITNKPNSTIHERADELKETLKMYIEELPDWGMIEQVRNAFVSDVNFNEIVKNWEEN